MSADKELKAFIDRILRMKEEQDAISADIRDIYAEAKMQGYDKTAMGKVVAYLRKIEKSGPDAANEQEMLFDTYLSAYEGRSGTPVATHTHETDHDPETGEVRDINPRLAKLVVDGMQTEVGRAALLTAVGIMIDREEAEQNTPSDAPHTSVSTVTIPSSDSEGEVPHGLPESSPETADEMDREEMRVGEAGHSLPAENARKAIPETEDGNVTHADAGEIPATHSEHSVAGGDHEVAQLLTAAEAVASVSTATANKPLRPHCLRPGEPDCAGYGDKTCHACLVAARSSGEAA